MRKLLVILAPAALMAGCSEELVFPPPPIEEEVTYEIPLRNVENAVYNELTDSWMIPQADPYTLENFQQAYDNLASGKSLQTLTRAEASEFSAAEKLEPTHYALKIYPKTEEEQWRVEMMEDVGVVYAPFNYSGLSQEEIARVPQTRSEIPSPFEKSPYTVTHDYTEATDGGPTGPVTYQLPILYAVWPVAKPLPEDLEYVVDYDIFLPHAASPETMSHESMQVLSNEAVAMALGVLPAPITPTTRGAAALYIAGRFMAYDNILDKNVPMANLRVQCVKGSYITNGVTDSNGYFRMYLYMEFAGQHNFDVKAIFQDISGRWRISEDDVTTIPLHSNSYFVSASNIYPGFTVDYGNIVLSQSARRENLIHCAVNYYYNIQTTFPKPPVQHVLTIWADSRFGRPSHNWSSECKDGNLTSSSSDIHMYNRRSDSGFTGDVLHEIGHLIHAHCGSQYLAPNKFMKESFACYVGWYLGEAYYTSHGWIKPEANSDITVYGRQSWSKNNSIASDGHYSPLFIDMTDDYNQSTANAKLPNDNISGIPASAIWNIVSTSSDYWTQVRPKIVNLAGTQPNFNEWVQNFDDSPLNN